MSAAGASVTAMVPTREVMAAVGAALARVLRAGDLVVLSGDLGAGKTTLTRGLGAALGVRGEVTSPTFVLARVHPSLAAGPSLVHVDAYRLGSLVEVDDLDLDASLADSVTVVEWGEGRVEALAEDRLEIRLDRPTAGIPAAAVLGPDGPAGSDGDSGADSGGDSGDNGGDSGDDGDEPRTVTLRGVGRRWSDVDLAAVLAPVPGVECPVVAAAAGSRTATTAHSTEGAGAAD